MDITRQVESAVSEMGARDGHCMVFVSHTTAAITINENADPDVKRDILMGLRHIVPDNLDYHHAEGNSPAHLKTSLMGSSEIIAIKDGRLALGTWQGITFCEFDGPRSRKVNVTIL